MTGSNNKHEYERANAYMLESCFFYLSLHITITLPMSVKTVTAYLLGWTVRWLAGRLLYLACFYAASEMTRM